ncbi:unnamed protein product [Durusdinium trenchii]|uniref:Uncharacterized protein n=1 Tax=Durusdinium trenchii TaxID=1381693 RepID=A0ABP0PPM4_9DINO
MEDSFPCAAPGCESTGSKLCSRCGKAAYCSAECQRKDWKVHKLQCQKAETPENRISDHLAKGQLFSAQEALQQLEKPNARLAAELEEKLKLGILSEVIADRLSLQPARYGLGYVAAKDLSAGDPLLFDTAFCSAPMDGDQEFYCTIAEKSIRKGHADRRASARVDAQADFYYDSLLKLCTKDSHDRATLEGTEMEADTREQILVCSIAEANSLYCTEEPNFAALYAAGARFNHSCAPNASIESSRSRLLVRAATAIPKGMEVTISYLPPQLLSEAGPKRRERLAAGRGFQCRCDRCEAADEPSEQKWSGGAKPERSSIPAPTAEALVQYAEKFIAKAKPGGEKTSLWDAVGSPVLKSQEPAGLLPKALPRAPPPRPDPATTKPAVPADEPRAKAPEGSQESQVGEKRKRGVTPSSSGGPRPVFKVGDQVQYYSTSKGGWMTTMVKAVHFDDAGKVHAYDCSGKQGAPPSKVRAPKPDAPAQPKPAKPAKPAKSNVQAADADPGEATRPKASKLPKAPRAPAPGPKAAAAAVQLYHVGQKVRYWSTNMKQWFDTKIKAVNVNSQGQLLSYDLSGKPRAAPEKIRPQKRFAKAAATVKSGAAKAAAEAKGEAAAVAQAHEVQAQVAPEAPNGAQTQAAKDQTPRTSTAKFQVGQQVFYLSGQLNQYLPAEVTRLLRTPSGKRFYDLNIKKSVPESKILTTAQASKAHHEATLLRRRLRRRSGSWRRGATSGMAARACHPHRPRRRHKKRRSRQGHPLLDLTDSLQMLLLKRGQSLCGHVLEEELALLRRQLEERPLRQEVVAAPSAVPEDLQAQLVQLQAERQQLEAECARRTAQKEELVLQLEEALAKSESVQLKELQQSLDEAEAAQQRLSQQWSSAKKQLQHAKAEGDMLTSELQKLGQQLQDSQAQTEALQRECDELRARYNNLEADHSDLNLRAEEALAGHEALTAEHQRVIEQAKQLQSRQGLEDEGLRKTHQALEAELLKVQAERDILAKQVKDQELYTAARQEDLKADAERLRDENLARADEWKAIVSELADLRSSRAALDTKCAELIDKAADASEECQKQRGLAESFRSESETLKGELQQLQKAVLDAASQQQITAEEAERLRNEAAELEATRRALQREVDEYRRQMETSSVERGASEAELARLEACAEALAEENHQLRSRIDTLAPKDAEEAYAAAIISAEQWVLYHAGMPLEGTSMPYLSGVTISFAEFYAPLLSLVFASPPQQLRSAAAAVENGELARASLQCFRLCDAQRVGRLTWEEVQDLSDAVFQRKGLPTPSQDVQYLMFTKFDKECASRLHAQDCLCWVDALFRAMLMSPAAVAARVSEAPEGPIVSGPRSGAAPAPSEARLLQESVAQGRLQKRLDEAQSAAERAVAAAGSRSEPLTATANSGLDGMLLSGREGVPRASQPVYRTVGRVWQSNESSWDEHHSLNNNGFTLACSPCRLQNTKTI